MPYVVEWFRRERDGEPQLTWNQFEGWMADVEPMAAAAAVHPVDHEAARRPPSPPPPSPQLPAVPPPPAAIATAADDAASRPVDRGSAAVQLYTQVARLAAQQWRQDKLANFHQAKAASQEELRTNGEADMLLQRAGIKPIKEQRRKQQEEEVERQERAERWRVNRGEAAAKVPFLPKELWSLIYNQRNIESERYKAWQRWANKRLMQLVAIWFRTGGQRNSKWLGTLMGSNGGIAHASTDSIETRFRPWCNAILRPGEENHPVHFSGTKGAPVTFVNVYVHMLSMMNYMGFHDVIGQLKGILRTFARCLQPGSDVPKYIPGPPDSEDENDEWTTEVPDPGVQPPPPFKRYVTPASRPSGAARAQPGRSYRN